MRITSNPRLAMISLLCGAAFAGSTAIAQDATSSTDTQNQIKPSSDQSQSFFDGLGGLPTQSATGFQPSVGGTVPDSVKLHPMPADSAKAVPAAKDHHVAKTDDNTAVIAHPESRKILGVVSADDSTASTGGSSSGTSGSSNGSGSTGSDSDSSGSSSNN